jgi:hypothetical protein
MRREPIFEPGSGPPVRGVLHRPDSVTAALALTHGAGSGCDAPLLVALSDLLAEAGYAVLRFDLPFRQRRPHGPPTGSASADQAGIVRAVELLRGLFPGKVFAGGQSYGGRQTTMAAADQPDLVAGLLLLSYPLHAPGKTQMRTAHFPRLRAPALFVQGTKDPFASPEEIETACKVLPAENSLVLVEGAGHDLGYGRKKADPALVPRIVGRFRAFFEAARPSEL